MKLILKTIIILISVFLVSCENEENIMTNNSKMQSSRKFVTLKELSDKPYLVQKILEFKNSPQVNELKQNSKGEKHLLRR